MAVKKAPVAHRRSGQAIELFEKAVKALGKRDYEKAQELLDELIAAHPGERDLLERARSYRTLCERSLERKPSFRPKTFEDMLTYGVFLHNKGEFQEALKYLHQAAEIHPKNEHAQYCLAATAARAGEAATALKALRSAIGANPANRAQARSDADFEAIRQDAEFHALVHPQAS